MRSALRSNRGGSMNDAIRFRLASEPILRKGSLLPRAEALIDAVRKLRDEGDHTAFAAARAVEDLFLDVYVPQLRLWDAARRRGADWLAGDPRSCMQESLERVIANALGEIDSTTVFCAGLCFLPSNKKED